MPYRARPGIFFFVLAIVVICTFSFFLTKKKQKVKGKRILRLFSGPTHFDSIRSMIVYWYQSGNARLRCVVCWASKGAVFRLGFVMAIGFLIASRNKALEDSFKNFNTFWNPPSKYNTLEISICCFFVVSIFYIKPVTTIGCLI